MTILLTGGTGKTSLRLASLLHSSSIPVLLTSRRGPSASSTYPTVRFDWNDSTTWSNPFSAASDISAVYLLSGELSDPAPILNAFIDLTMSKGVKRFVLCSGSSCEYGGPFHGKIWQKLDESGVEWAVLRPSWFMEPGHGHFETITQYSKIFTACSDGKIPWVSANDIAAVAFRCLTDKKPHNRAYRILGPELLTYDETKVAQKLSKHLDKQITHVKLSPEQRIKGMKDAGLPEEMAKFLTGLEIMAAEGKETWQGNDVELVTGKKAISFDEFVVANKQAWN
ncbi:NAD(P)-binding protein [Aureobasidium sp. EXF-3400]|nr:NAD(P)-binding protein [Aureobasidium sp. EXF-12344]KAI4784864.1 NAD(P)-binding protein [Aureobasidium sp. EXF-3400]